MSIIFLPRRAFQAVGCLYVAYWALFFGIAAVLIITSYLHEHKHHPAGKPASHEASVTTQKRQNVERRRVIRGKFAPLTGSAGMGEQNLSKESPQVKVGQLVVLVDEVDGLEAGREGCIMGVARRHAHGRLPNVRTLALGPGAHLAGSASGALPPFEREGRKGSDE